MRIHHKQEISGVIDKSVSLRWIRRSRDTFGEYRDDFGMGEKIKRYLRMIVRYDGNEHEDDAQTLTFDYDDGEAHA